MDPKTPVIPLYRVAWEEADVEAVATVIRRGMYWSDGPEVKEFEQKVAGYVGVRHGVAVNSGTSALYVLLQALSVTDRTLVAAPSWTYISTINPILSLGGEALFVDVEPGTMGLDPHLLNDALQSSPVKIVIAVTVGGTPCLLDEISKVCEENNVPLIVDDAESLGATIRGRKTASYGAAAALSFAPNKIISTGEGGMIVTNDDDLAEKVRLHSSYLGTKHSRIRGANLRMSCLNAALGVSQLSRIEENIQRRRRAADRYRRLLEGTPITLPVERAGIRHVYQMYTIQIPRGRDAAKALLESRGVNCKVYFDPVHLLPGYPSKAPLPVTEHLQRVCLSLPIHPGIREDEVDAVASLLRDSDYRKTA